MANEEALLDAVGRGDVLEVKRLIQSGLDPNASDASGSTALFIAILCGDLAMVQVLAELGADPNYIATEPGEKVYADTPLSLALQARDVMSYDTYEPIVKLLLALGAKPLVI